MARLTSTGILFDLADSANSINTFYWLYPVGTKKFFFQATAPTGWTQDTSMGNRALRVVSGTGGGTGGSQGFTTILNNSATIDIDVDESFPISGSVGNHTLTLSQLPNHTHPSTFGPAGGAGSTPFSNTGNRLRSGSDSTGGILNAPTTGGSHDHPWSGTATINQSFSVNINLAVQYVDMILCSLN